MKTTWVIKILETSPLHFAVVTKGIRVVFLQTNGSMATEFYLKTVSDDSAHSTLRTLTDPNGNRIIISQEDLKNIV